jgi:hypothetical protein
MLATIQLIHKLQYNIIAGYNTINAGSYTISLLATKSTQATKQYNCWLQYNINAGLYTISLLAYSATTMNICLFLGAPASWPPCVVVTGTHTLHTHTPALKPLLLWLRQAALLGTHLELRQARTLACTHTHTHTHTHKSNTAV